MKTLTITLILLLPVLASCSRTADWAVSKVQNLSDAASRRLRVEVVVEDQIPWPLNLSMTAVDSSKKHIEASLPRWTARKMGPKLVTFEFDEPITGQTKACVLDLKITAKGHSNLYVHQVLD